MKLIIVGIGKVGGTLVEKLAKENHDVIVVDYNVSVINHYVNKFDILGLVGSGCERDTLINAGVDTCDFFIACTSRDEQNILSCVLAQKLGAKHTVARVRDPEYFKESKYMQEDLGIDMFINPEYRTAKEVQNILKFPSASNIETFVDGKVSIMQFSINYGNPLINETIQNIASKAQAKVLFGMVSRGDKVFIPKGDFEIKLNDKIHIIGTESEISSFCKKMQIFKAPAKSVFIVGGGKIAFYLAQELEKSNITVKILEKDKKRCEELNQTLSKAIILEGDGTDSDILAEEGVSNCDAFITLTGIDEENTIMSLYSLTKNVNKVITKIDKLSISDMVKKLGLDTIITPKNIIANQIISFIRSNQTFVGNGVNTLYKLHDKAEALEFTVRENFKQQNIPLKNIKIKQNVLICGIVRDLEFILPNGNSKLKLNDRVVIITTEKQITDLNQILR